MFRLTSDTKNIQIWLFITVPPSSYYYLQEIVRKRGRTLTIKLVWSELKNIVAWYFPDLTLIYIKTQFMRIDLAIRRLLFVRALQIKVGYLRQY